MPPSAVFFDMDGVLLDSFASWHAVMNAAAVHFGSPEISNDAFRKVFGQSTAADAEQFYPGRTPVEVDEFYIANFASFTSLATATPGAQTLLDELDRKSIATAVVTNTHSAIARPLLEALELIPHALIAADDVTNPKPSPDMIFRGCEVLGLVPWDVVVVGDSRFDQQAAAAAGSPFAGFGGIGGNFTIADLNDVWTILDGTFS